MENGMTEAGNANVSGAAKASGRCGGSHDHSGHAHRERHTDCKTTVRDSVCGMSVDPASSQHRLDYQSDTFHFCSAGCRTKFAANPQSYLNKSEPKTAVPEGAIYTCPMHPQIRQIGP